MTGITIGKAYVTISLRDCKITHPLCTKGTYVNLASDFKKKNFVYMHWTELDLYPIVLLFFSFIPQRVRRKKIFFNVSTPL